jgi:hypothetical protein
MMRTAIQSAGAVAQWRSVNNRDHRAQSLQAGANRFRLELKSRRGFALLLTHHLIRKVCNFLGSGDENPVSPPLAGFIS